MSAATPAATRRPEGSAELAAARRALKQTWVGATVCALVFGGTAAASALSYVSAFPDALSRQQLAATTSSDRGLAVLLGPVRAVDTVGGYTVYKGFVFLTTIGAIWAILVANRLLRGEEDSGRWQLMLAGSTRASRITAATLVALTAAVGIILAGTVAFTLLAARDPDVGFSTGDTLLYGVSLVVPPAVFVAVGAVTSQLGRNRRAANGLGTAVVGVAFVLRMIADTGAGTRWLLWATPFGWTELMQPFTHDDAWPVVPAVITVLALGALAVALASRRDSGDGLIASRDVSALRPFGLRSAFGMSARLELPVLVAWCLGSALAGLVLGVIAKMTTAAAPASLSDLLDDFDVHGSFADRYFGVVFLLVATVVALLPASQIGAAGEEHTTGRLVHVLSRPVGRARWFAGRLVLAALAVVAAGLLAGLGAWLGAVSQRVGVGLAAMLAAGFNVVPTALLVLAMGATVLAVAPRMAAATVYGVVILSLIIDLVASTVSDFRWLERASLFHYMALAPADDPDPRTLAVTTTAALALGLVATLLFRRRDVQTG